MLFRNHVLDQLHLAHTSLTDEGIDAQKWIVTVSIFQSCIVNRLIVYINNKHSTFTNNSNNDRNDNQIIIMIAIIIIIIIITIACT